MWFSDKEELYWRFMFGIWTMTLSHHGCWRVGNPLCDWAVKVDRDGNVLGCVKAA